MKNKFLVSCFLLILSLLTLPVSVRAYVDIPEYSSQVVRLKADAGGDYLCFDINVREAETSTKYRTIGWIIKINGIGIIKKYMASEYGSETFYFRIAELENEYLRQYGLQSGEYASVINALYKTGGSITFDAINTYTSNGELQGSIIDMPVYNRGSTYNYRGNVFDTLVEIQNACNWSVYTRETDLPKYYGISYNFSPQPGINGSVTVNYLDDRGRSIKGSMTIKRTFGLNNKSDVAITVPEISGYNFDGWSVMRGNSEISNGFARDFDVTLNKDLPILVVNINYVNYSVLPDLKIISITPDNYRRNTKVLTLVKIRNVGGRDFGPDTPVDVMLKIDSASYTRKIDIGRNMEITVPFVWNTASKKSAKLTASVNYNLKYPELVYSNNSKTITACIEPFIVPVVEESPPVPIIPMPQIQNNNYIEWKEWRFKRWDESKGYRIALYDEKKFWARLSVSALSDPETMKSGYGFNLNATTKIETNYDHPEFIIEPQRVNILLPETQYKLFRMLIKSVNNAGDWTLPVNQLSMYGRSVHYIPVWFPDKIYYQMCVTAFDSYCPGGSLSSSSTPKIWVDGNMYQDDYSGRIWTKSAHD